MLWEAEIKGVKLRTRELFSNATPNVEELEALLCQMESFWKSHPSCLPRGRYRLFLFLMSANTCCLAGNFSNEFGNIFGFCGHKIIFSLCNSEPSGFHISLILKLGIFHLWGMQIFQFISGSWLKFKCTLGRDGTVQVVHVKTAHTVFVRPTSQLVRLPISNDSSFN